MKRIAIVWAFGLIVTGCISTYQETPQSATTSLLTFEKGYSVGAALGRATLQEYWVVADQACNQPQRAAAFTFATGASEARRFPTDQPVQLVARTRFLTGQGGTSTGQPGARVMANECQAYVRFVPQKGQTYRITHRADPQAGCVLEVRDSQTQANPQGLVVQDHTFCPDGSLP